MTVASSAQLLCHGCGSVHVVRLGSKTGSFSGQHFDYYRCERCRLGFVEPFLGYEIYNHDYYLGRGPDPFVDYESEYRDYRKTDRLLEFDDVARVAGGLLEKRVEHKSPVEWLDFGCGAGGLLKYLRDHGTLNHGKQRWPLRLCGHDVGEFAQRLKSIDGFRILSYDELAKLPDAQFDIISMVEVIEHIRTPFDVIALAARLLRPGGILLLTTGNMDSPISKRQGLNYRYHIPEIHISHFNPRTLAFAYAQSGLQPLRVRYRGAVRFKVIKSLPQPVARMIARVALHVPGVTRLIDLAYGVSAMPCATKAF